MKFLMPRTILDPVASGSRYSPSLSKTALKLVEPSELMLRILMLAAVELAGSETHSDAWL